MVAPDNCIITIIYSRKEHYGVRLKVVQLGDLETKGPATHRIQELVFRNFIHNRISFERSGGNNFKIFNLHKSSDCTYEKVLVEYGRVFADIDEIISAINKYYE